MTAYFFYRVLMTLLCLLYSLECYEKDVQTITGQNVTDITKVEATYQ